MRSGTRKLAVTAHYPSSERMWGHSDFELYEDPGVLTERLETGACKRRP